MLNGYCSGCTVLTTHPPRLRRHPTLHRHQDWFVVEDPLTSLEWPVEHNVAVVVAVAVAVVVVVDTFVVVVVVAAAAVVVDGDVAVVAAGIAVAVGVLDVSLWPCGL